MNARGMVSVALVGIMAISIAGLGIYKTKQNGVLKNNGKKILCKMQNKGEDFCNKEYAFTPEAYHWETQVKEINIPVYVPVGE